MKFLFLVVLGWAAAFGAWGGEQDPKVDPRVLGEIGRGVAKVVARGETPVVLFDIDDTLTDSRTRIVKILRVLGADRDFGSRFPLEAQLLYQAPLRDTLYDIGDTLQRLGLRDPDAIKEATEYWKPRFFSNLCAADRPISGAAKYLHWLVSKGAKLVYLTGRDEPGMGKGTRASLERSHFPTDSALLIMRPDPKDDELEFKKRSLAMVAKMGVVVGVFENEPRNLNMMMEAFPKARGVFVNTIHSKRPDAPNAGARWLRNYTRRASPGKDN